MTDDDWLLVFPRFDIASLVVDTGTRNCPSVEPSALFWHGIMFLAVRYGIHYSRMATRMMR